MSCCSRKKTDGKEPQSIKTQSDPPSVKIAAKRPSNSVEIEYLITIKTGDHRNSGTDGPVYIKIFGRDDKQTKEILLTSPFRHDSIKQIQVKAIDIGKPQRIILRHEDKTNGWYIDYVEISVHNFLIRFVANRWLNEAKHDRKLAVELFGSEQPAVEYNIEVRTGDEQIEPLDSPVYIQIYGTTTTTPKLFLESKHPSFTKDSIAKFNLSSNYVGEIQKIVIGHENLGTVHDWYLQNVKIQTAGQEYEFTVNKWLSPTKDDKQLFVELNHAPPRPSSPRLPTYLIIVKTIDVPGTEAIENIEMSIHGSNGQIDKMLLKNFVKSNEQPIFRQGSVDRFEIQQKDIGNIESITVGFDDHERKTAWLLESIDIQYKEIVYHFQADCWLSTRLGPNFSWITIKPDTNNNDINYNVIIETGETGIDSNVMLCIYGDQDTTKHFALRTIKDGSQAKFNQQSRLEFVLKGIDVGKIKKINIGHDGKGDKQQWFLKSIEIDKNDEHYKFQADRYLNEQTETFIDLSPEVPTPKKDQTIYTITIVTSSEKDSGTDSGVFMTIYGDKGQTKTFQLITTKQDSELLFKPGGANQFEFELDDVGIINKINIGQDGKGLHPVWHPETVQIQKGSEIYIFHTDQVLDYSTPDVDLTPILPDIEKLSSSEHIEFPTPPSNTSEKITETTYKVLAQFHSLQQTAIDDEANLYLVIVGNNGQTERLPLSNNEKGEMEFTTTDVGKISKIHLGQEENHHGIIWHIDNLIIKQGTETTTFNINRSIEQNNEIELTPSPLHQPSETSTSVVKMKDINYEIKTTTGETNFDGDVTIKIRGEFGIICIPLSNTKSGNKPFRSKAIDVFTSETTDVGKIKRITIEHNQIKPNYSWHLKKIQIIKGIETYNFNANVYLDYEEPKVSLYPTVQRREDYVHSELRRLRESLRSESSKMRRPAHKAHEPFVYNDLRPYFDTTNVEKAIHEPLETPPGYYTRLTALRIVEPWEAYGMDYGVNYELLKQRGSRSYSLKRSSSTQNGIMILPPLALPFGGQIASVSPIKLNRSRSSSIKRRSSLKQNNEPIPITTITA